MLTADFLSQLEYSISAALRNSQDKSLWRYWCDGILEAEREIDNSPEQVAQSQQLSLRAWIDEGRRKGGSSSVQNLYQLTLTLGPKSFLAYLQGRSLEEWILESPPGDWVKIDPENQLIEFRLP